MLPGVRSDTLLSQRSSLVLALTATAVVVANLLLVRDAADRTDEQRTSGTETRLSATLESLDAALREREAATKRAEGKSPKRTFGPHKSCRIATGRPTRAAIARTASMRRRWSEWEPWEKLIRATSRPARTKASNRSRSSTAGPSVQTILVRRMAGEIAG